METTKTKSVICSNCGGQMDVNTLEENVECPFCGTKYAVSDLLNESDAVRIEKIKINAQQKMEQEKMKNEMEQNKNQEEKEEITKFKKSIFAKIILVLFAFSVLFFFLMDGFLTKALLLIQAVLLIVSWLTGSKIIKSKAKGLHTILAIIAFVLIVPIVSIGGGNSSKKYEKIVWDDIAMNDILPEPKNDKGTIYLNSEKYLSMYIGNVTKEDYSKYVEECKSKGFTVESEKDTNSYNAFNADGYKLKISYSDYSKEYAINLDAPMEMKENAWVSTPLSKLVPEPTSKVGKVDSNSEKYFTYYAGKTSKDDFASYANSVLNAGFSNDYHSGDDYFYAKNADGYKVDIRYNGNNIMEISLTAPDKSNTNTNTNTTPVEEAKPETNPETTTPTTTPEPAPTTTTTPTTTESQPANSTGIGKEFKEAMDSYEAFIDEYIAFMKKYEASNGTDISLIADYAKYMSKLDDANKKFEKWEDESMNAQETAYYIQVQTRVNQKLLEVATQ